MLTSCMVPSKQLRPKRLQLCATPSAGLGADVQREPLPRPPPSVQQDPGRAVSHQSNHRGEGAVLRLIGCRYFIMIGGILIDWVLMTRQKGKSSAVNLLLVTVSYGAGDQTIRLH